MAAVLSWEARNRCDGLGFPRATFNTWYNINAQDGVGFRVATALVP